ncbi:fungal-specific transcription factor domain-containing protein [Xylariales sp. AK1849]|nr:fungal-specific transcription factor domain-containing protein [Xylariales sp. AK1849]
MAATNGEITTMSDPSPTDISNQENVSARSTVSRQSTKQQVRHRASVACASCRDRRIRCVVPKGEMECTQCKRAGAECVIKNDDERRRPISKAYMSSLSDRIHVLEGMLKDKGVDLPPAAHPPRSRHECADSQDEPGRNNGRSFSHARDTRNTVPSPPDSANEDFPMHESDQADSLILPSTDYQAMDFLPSPREPPVFRIFDPKQEDIVHRLLSTRGNLSFDQISGRLRFFGPTANSHVHAGSSDRLDAREPPEQVRRAERIIRSLTTTTYDYLMSVFWEHYNGVLVVIDQESFEADRESQNPKFYSSFLHIAMLSAGYRFADKDRDDIDGISLGNRESTLHREAKHMLDIELERPGGIPSVQALLLLGDLECGVGRDNTGWMYSGMANRLAFDIGLHLDCSNKGLSEREVSIRHMTMRACVIYDKYWALFLGRPTSIKNQDIGMDLLSRKFTSMLSSTSAGSQSARTKRSLGQEVYDQLVELMELAGRIVEIRDHNKASSRTRENGMFAAAAAEDNAYLHVIDLDRQLQNWYRRLPDHLTWKPANIKTAPSSFFLLHQQYHVSMILLHRPWAKYQPMTDDSGTDSHPSPENAANPSGPANEHHLSVTGHALGPGDQNSIVDDGRTSLSRSICTQQAMRVSRIIWQHRQRFSGKKVFVTGIQHAGTAAIALIAALAHPQGEADRRSHLSYLEVISLAIHDMSETYHPAERMDALLNAVIIQLRQDLSDPYRTRTNSFAQPTAGSVHSNLGGGQPWQKSRLDGLYSVLSARRGNPDADQGPAQKKRPRPTPSRRASEVARPPPPFAGSLSRPTPPGSTRSRNPLSFDLHQGLFPGFGEHPTPFNLTSLQDSAIEMDTADDHQAVTTGRATDNYLLVNSSPGDHWGLPGTNQDNSLPDQEPGFLMSDWVAGPAGLSASTVLNASEHQQNGMATAGLTASRRTTGKRDRQTTVEWMGGEGGLNALSPISLGGLVQCVEKAAGAGEDKSSTLPRNHELDFFSFS